MKSQPTIQRMLLATLMVFATAAIGLQPSVFGWGSGCTCDTSVSAVANASLDVTACCRSLAEEQKQTSSCSSQPVMAKKCCCNPHALACECGDCGCSEVNDSHPSLPAIPHNDTREVVTPTLICAAPFVGYPRECEIKRVRYPNTVAEFAALTSQQTCVLLSRFTC